MFCSICKRERAPVEFYRRMNSRCKDCHKAAMKRLRLTDPAVQKRERDRAKKPHRVAMASANTAKWRAAHPDAYKAQNAVNNAVRDGKLKRDPCAICGTTSRVHAHHQDYSKPLEVKWLCAKCHHRLHSAFPELGGHYEVRA